MTLKIRFTSLAAKSARSISVSTGRKRVNAVFAIETTASDVADNDIGQGGYLIRRLKNSAEVNCEK